MEHDGAEPRPARRLLGLDRGPERVETVGLGGRCSGTKNANKKSGQMSGRFNAAESVVIARSIVNRCGYIVFAVEAVNQVSERPLIRHWVRLSKAIPHELKSLAP
jgi:hypothetical protein